MKNSDKSFRIICASFFSMCFLLVAACKDPGIKKCEEKLKRVTYKYEEACQCVQNAAKENNVLNFEDFIEFLSNPSTDKAFDSAFMANAFSANTSPKLKSYMTTIVDSAAFCHLRDNAPIQESILTNSGSEYLTNINGVSTVLSKEEKKELLNNKEFKKLLYRELSFVDLVDWVQKNIKNVNIKNFLESKNLKEGYQKFEIAPENTKAMILSIFNSDFARAYYYFHKRLNLDKQEAIDQAYLQALVVVSMNLSDSKSFLKYDDDFGQVYSNKEISAIVTNEHVKIMKKYMEKN